MWQKAVEDILEVCPRTTPNLQDIQGLPCCTRSHLIQLLEKFHLNWQNLLTLVFGFYTYLKRFTDHVVVVTEFVTDSGKDPFAKYSEDDIDSEDD